MNPRLQDCLQEYKFEIYENNGNIIKANINDLNTLDLNYLPKENKKLLENTFTNAILTFKLVENIKLTQSNLNEYSKDYKSLHQTVRKIQKRINKINIKVKKLEKEQKYLERDNEIIKADKIKSRIDKLNREKINISEKIPPNWEDENNQYKGLALKNKKATTLYRRNVDSIYEDVQLIKKIIIDRDKLNNLDNEILNLKEKIFNVSKVDGMNEIKSIEKVLNEIAGADLIKEKLSKARRILKKDDPDINKIIKLIDEAYGIFLLEKEWRQKAEVELLPQIIKFDDSIKTTIGLRQQEKLTKEQAIYVAACRSTHKDISLNF